MPLVLGGYKPKMQEFGISMCTNLVNVYLILSYVVLHQFRHQNFVLQCYLANVLAERLKS